MRCKSTCDQQLRLRADINILIEQPSSSWAFRLPIMETVLKTWSMHTWHELFAIDCLHMFAHHVVICCGWPMMTYGHMMWHAVFSVLFLVCVEYVWRRQAQDHNVDGVLRTWSLQVLASHLMVSSSFRRVASFCLSVFCLYLCHSLPGQI